MALSPGPLGQIISMLDVSHPYFDTNLSWLSYTHRLLMEAKDETVPPRERVHFLGLFSEQLGDFIKVKIPMLKAMSEVSRDILEKLNLYPESLLAHIHEIIENQSEEFNTILCNQVRPALENQGVHLYFKEPFLEVHSEFARKFFTEQLFRYLQPVFLSGKKSFKSCFPDPAIFHLIVRLQKHDQVLLSVAGSPVDPHFVSVNIPTAYSSRFVELPEQGGTRYVAFLEDIIRFNLDLLFPGYTVLECFVLQSDRSPQLELEDDHPLPLANRIHKQLEKQNFVVPQSFLYESGMPESMKEFLAEKFDAPLQEWLQQGEYLNYADFRQFPGIGKKADYPAQQPVHYAGWNPAESLLDSLLAKEMLLHLPYHSYLPVLKFFNDAAVDPFVREIHVSLYKIHANSFLVNSLMSAARNGKKVIAFVELNTRFDVQENMLWSKKMKEAGVKVIFSAPGLKMHAKIALVKRKAKKGWERFAYLGTGGFYRLTARKITDHTLLTSDRELCNELELLFAYMATGEEPKKYKYLPFSQLQVSQFNMHRKLVDMIDQEIRYSKMGQRASIILKINQLQDKQLIDKLYHAVRMGVSVTLIVTNCVCLIPDLPTISDNITVLRVVDRYVENTRIFYFYNNGKEAIFLSSGDWTFRNFHRRIDVCFPIADPGFKNEMKQVLKNYLNDNQKAVRLDTYQNNLSLNYSEANTKVRAQEANYKLVDRLEDKSVLVK